MRCRNRIVSSRLASMSMEAVIRVAPCIALELDRVTLP